MASSIIWRNVAIYILLAVIIGLALAYLFDVYGFKIRINTLFAGSALPALPKIDLNGVVNWVSQNGALVGVGTTLGTTALAYFIKNYQTNKLLNQASEELTVTKGKLNVASQNALNASNLQAQLDELNNDTTSEILQKNLSAVSRERDLLNERYLESQRNNKALQNMLDARPVIKIKEIS